MLGRMWCEVNGSNFGTVKDLCATSGCMLEHQVVRL